MHPIDFVVPWVDGSDPEWQEEFKKYNPDPDSCDARFERYRDWDLMRYWFRGVEKNAPWVNKIYFITWGHVPEWLNVNHPKLVIVKHEDYIPAEYLPTFSANPIELNMHRIKGLSEHFVYFNDDFFLLNKTKPEDFFVNGFPCDMAVENPISINDEVFAGILMNNTSLINKHFNKKFVISSNKSKWFSVKYGLHLLRTLLMSFWSCFVGLQYQHISQPFLKSTLFEVWKNNENFLNDVCKNKFRSRSDVNQYLFKNWQLCSGKFYPFNPFKLGRSFLVSDPKLSGIVRNTELKIICLNDDSVNDDRFMTIKESLIESFESRTIKSSFEL
ncbi:stealth family protein [Vibrio owensii]|uniref:stealth family protein n=1 Tax=Vibrio owensii TaxID=696485 RepID=UPI003DA0E5D1